MNITVLIFSVTNVIYSQNNYNLTRSNYSHVTCEMRQQESIIIFWFVIVVISVCDR